MMRAIAMACLCTVAVLAQDSAEKATVTLHDPSRPARVRAHLLNGSLTVRGADVKNITVEARGRGRHETRESRAPGTEGMHRLDMSAAGMEVSEDNNVVNIKTSAFSTPTDLLITVPLRSSLELKSVNNGDIEIEHVDGEIDANALNGKVVLKNVAGSVIAHSLNGSVLATIARIDPGKPLSFSTMNGEIDVTLPDDVKANVRIKTDNGEIYSDFDVKLESGNRADTKRQPDGTYQIRFDRTLRGTINGGGPEFQFTSFNGNIIIRKRK